MSETQQLGSRIDEFVAQLGADYPKEKIIRAMLARVCDLSLADRGLLATMCMMESVVSLLAGQWGPERVQTFIETPNP